MARWFRRKDKGRDEGLAPPPEEVSASAPLEAGSPLPEPELLPEAADEVAAGFKPAATTPIEAAEENAAEAAEARRGRFHRLRERLGRTREALAGGLTASSRGGGRWTPSSWRIWRNY